MINWVHELEQLTGATRHIVEIMGILRRQFIEQGFTESGAESMAEMVGYWILEQGDVD